MAVVKSVTGALVVLVIVVAVVGVGLGLALSDTGILNPTTSTARELQMAEQTRHQAAINVLQEGKMAEELRLELDQRGRQFELDLQLQETRGRVLAIAVAVALVAIAIGVAVLLAGLGVAGQLYRVRARRVPPQGTRSSGRTVPSELRGLSWHGKEREALVRDSLVSSFPSMCHTGPHRPLPRN